MEVRECYGEYVGGVMERGKDDGGGNWVVVEPAYVCVYVEEVEVIAMAMAMACMKWVNCC